MNSVVLPTYRVTLTNPDLHAADVRNPELLGSPVNVVVPSRAGGTSMATGVICEIGDGFMVVEFIAEGDT